ncbi:MAG TPA: N-formylglutamate deformylase [Alphaproteobacteria bacterium]|nr:N-formylglutamate deformylase [Alphaproteobacteria bacterium]
MSEIYRFLPGSLPLLLSIPHCGTQIPDHFAARMTPAALVLADTDWHVDKLYDFASARGAFLLMANFSRYVVDLNRDPEGKALYPGAENTGVVPLDTFDRLPLYRPGNAPDRDELRRRIDVYWQPYHDRLVHELERIKEKFGFALLFDAHSIRSRVPRFFAGRLPDFNLGTASGASMEASLARRLLAICQEAAGYTSVLDGRFTGGYITRRYGRPGDGVQAVQLELAQLTYMDESPPFRYRAERAAALRPTLERLFAELAAWAESRQRAATR